MLFIISIIITFVILVVEAHWSSTALYVALYGVVLCSCVCIYPLCQKLSFDVVYGRGSEHEPSTEGMRNECCSASKVCQRQIDIFTLVPSDRVAPSSLQCIYGL